MSDPKAPETSTPAIASSEAPAPAPAEPANGNGASMFGVPMDVFVKGGTTSMKHDQMVAEWKVEDEKRRVVQDQQRQVASVPIEQGGARMYSRQTGTPQETAKVLLDYLNEAGEPLILDSKPIQCLADIIAGMNPKDPNDLAIVILCPYCWNKGLPAGRCQMHALQSNRNWHLDPRTQGDLMIFEGQAYQSAGIVMDSEPMTCQCGWKVRIDKNKVRTERRGS